VRDFYARETNSTTDFHRHLAQLPFRLCISASPDSLMLTAFEATDKRPQRDYYSFQAQRRGKCRCADLREPARVLSVRAS
jgi:hypothetical protein